MRRRALAGSFLRFVVRNSVSEITPTVASLPHPPAHIHPTHAPPPPPHPSPSPPPPSIPASTPNSITSPTQPPTSAPTSCPNLHTLPTFLTLQTILHPWRRFPCPIRYPPPRIVLPIVRISNPRV